MIDRASGEVMTRRKNIACNRLLLVCRRIQRRFADGYSPTFEQMNAFNAAIEAFDLELLCGHKLIDECECSEKAWNTIARSRPPKRLSRSVKP